MNWISIRDVRNSSGRARAANWGFALSLVGASLLVPLAQAGATSPPSIGAFAASSALVAPEGGAITLNATVSNGGTCTVSVKPAVTGFPASQDCIPIPGKPKKVSFPGSLPANASGKTISYAWSLTVSPPGSSAKVTKTIKVVQEAYALSSSYKLFSITGAPSRLSCVGTNFCMALSSASGGDSVFVQTSGAFKKVASVSTSLVDVSCASSTTCVLIDNAGNYYLYSGGHLSGNNPLYESGTKTPATLTSVSCPTTAFCMVVDAFGNTYSGAPNDIRESPTLPSRPSGKIATSVSCTSASYCVAADVDGDGYAFNGVSWTGPTTISTSSDGIVSVSCRESPTLHSTCVVITTKGHAFTVSEPDGSTGTVAIRESPSKAWIGRKIDCASPTFCLMSDGGGVYEVVNGVVGARIALSNGPNFAGPSCTASSSTSMTCKTIGKPKEFTGHVTLLK